MIVRSTTLLLCLLAGACGVHRELVIDSDPPGARVFMDREDLGLTPIRMEFEYGGVREFVLLHEEGDPAYTPMRVVQDTGEFFLDRFPFDVLARIAPVRTEREIRIEVTLEPSRLADLVMDDEDSYVKALLDRAETMRLRARRAQNEGDPAAPPFLESTQGAESRPTEESTTEDGDENLPARP